MFAYKMIRSLEKGYQCRETSHLIFPEVPHNLNTGKSLEMMSKYLYISQILTITHIC